MKKALSIKTLVSFLALLIISSLTACSGGGGGGGGGDSEYGVPSGLKLSMPCPGNGTWKTDTPSKTAKDKGMAAELNSSFHGRVVIDNWLVTVFPIEYEQTLCVEMPFTFSSGMTIWKTVCDYVASETGEVIKGYIDPTSGQADDNGNTFYMGKTVEGDDFKYWDYTAPERIYIMVDGSKRTLYYQGPPPPKANPGSDRVVELHSTVYLDGSSSTCSRGSLEYDWSFISKPDGSKTSFSNPGEAAPYFTPDKEGDYVIGLVVSDGYEDSLMKSVTISAMDFTDVAPDKALKTFGKIERSGDKDAYSFNLISGDELVVLVTSEIPDTDLVLTVWSPDGFTETKKDSGTFRMVVPMNALGDFTLIAEADGNATGNYDFNLFTNTIPKADPGPDRLIDVAAIANLDAGNSTDGDGDLLSFQWTLESKPAGSNAQLTHADQTNTSFQPDKEGEYLLELVVYDGISYSMTETVILTAIDITPVPVAEIKAMNARIDSGGDKDAFTFTGNAGDMVTIYLTDNLSSSLADLYVTVINPDGSNLISKHSSSAFELDTVLPADGTYTIFVKAEDAATGDYTLNFSNLSLDTWTAIPSVESKSLSGSITIPGDRDAFTFTGSAGDAISLYASDSLSSSLADLYVTILNPDGSTLESRNSSSSFEINTTLPADGTYTILVDAEGSATGDYTLNLSNLSLDTWTVIPSMESNSLSGCITIPGDRDAFTFTGSAGDPISLYASDSLSSSLADLSVTILNPDGSTLESRNSSSSFEINITLPADGTYTILVDAEGSATGDYSLYLSNLDIDTWGAISYGQSQSGIIEVPGDRDAFTFNGNSGDTLTFSATRNLSSSLADLCITIISPDGSVLTSRNSSSNSFQFNTSLTSTGSYIILVDAEGGATGNYQISLTKI